MTWTEIVMSSLEVSLENTVIFRVEVFLHSKNRSWLMTFWPDLSDPRVLESQSRVDFQNKTRPSPSLTNKVIFFPRNQQFTLSRLQKSILNFASHFRLNPDCQKCVEDFIKVYSASLVHLECGLSKIGGVHQMLLKDQGTLQSTGRV